MADSTRTGGFSLDEREAATEAADKWWLFLVTGIAWIVVAWLVLRWEPTSVSTIAYLFGVMAIFFGVNELLMMWGASVGWKIVHVLLGLVFVVAGVIALFNPARTFLALAGIIGIVFIVKGAFDVVVAIATRDEIAVWWLQLIAGIAQLLLGFWVSGPGFDEWGKRVVLLVLWVGFAALFRGITEIVFAFKLHGLKKELQGATA
ncbi:MAG: HdeD family acid-resistance protein [Gaiella sp.]